MANRELIHAIAHDLEQHSNSIRIRKLIFYICKRTWENDLDTLKSYPLNTLIQELIQLYPKLPELDSQLNKVARSLSKPAEYSLTANLILQKIRKLYSEVQPKPNIASKQQQILQIIDRFSQDKNSIRIKKILVYICRNIWENDGDRLSQYNLQELLEELLQIAPTLESLNLVLNSVVKTLNRQAEYTLVANTILGQIGNLYPKQADSTQLVTNDCSTQIVIQTELTNLIIEPQQTEISNPLELTSYIQIASFLEAQPEQIRIKKLVFCACRNHWENDPDNLHQVSLEVLIQELHAMAPAIADLKLLLCNIVNTLNRKAEYFLIADTLTQALEALYCCSTHSVPAVQSLGQQAQVSLNQPTDHHSSLPLEPPQGTTTAVENAYDLFELRLEIMKYTNPLRAKILLFSVLKHKFSFTTADWSTLKSCGFDDLLQQLLEQCDTLSTLESRLEIIASCLEDSAEYNQAAGAIIQCVKPFYPLIQRQQQLILATSVPSPIYSGQLSSEQTKIKLNFEETLLTTGHTIVEADDEHTRQFFSASNSSKNAVERSPSNLEQTCELSSTLPPQTSSFQ
ncbi:MAG: hypothetical protein KME12_08355 [Trichocoleus desertorum ATA4-8-CV12]|jgi:hypothetical protein|nr:hypothetical protein [Trichocoleus desertorum ATA4-8-CV12]